LRLHGASSAQGDGNSGRWHSPISILVIAKAVAKPVNQLLDTCRAKNGALPGKVDRRIFIGQNGCIKRCSLLSLGRIVSAGRNQRRGRWVWSTTRSSEPPKIAITKLNLQIEAADWTSVLELVFGRWKM